MDKITELLEDEEKLEQEITNIEAEIDAYQVVS